MQYSLFHEYGDPYARLVDAVRGVVPQIVASDVEPRLQVLAKCCLVKNPAERLSLVSWEDFLHMSTTGAQKDILREGIIKKIGIVRGNTVEDNEVDKRTVAYKRVLEFGKIIESIKEIIRGECVADRECFPPFDGIKVNNLTEHERIIIICFEPSESHSLSVALTLGLVVSFSGEPETIIEMKSIAIASTKCLPNLTVNGMGTQLVIKGPFDPTFVKEKLQILLLTLLNAGQDLSLKDLIGKHDGDFEDSLLLSL
jgi:hypothetical protein